MTMDAKRKYLEIGANVEIITSTSFVLGCPWWIPIDLSLDESQDSLDKLWQGLIKHQLLFHGICWGQVLKGVPKSDLG